MEKKKKKSENKLKTLLQVEAFRNDWEELQLNLMYSYHWLSGHLRNLFKDLEITPQQYQVLKIIAAANPDPVSIEWIKARVIEKDADMSRMIHRLSEQKLIKRQIKRTDRRASEISLTELGSKLLESAVEFQQKADQLFYNLSKKEAKQLNKLLNKIRT